MKKICHVNLGNFGSTGNIARDLANIARNNGYESYFAYPGNRLNKPCYPNEILIKPWYIRKISEKLYNILGLDGCFDIISTSIFLHRLKKIKPDIIHLHNLHSCYINLPMLFRYIKKNKIKVIWTLHDCWTFTGHCPHFDLIGCDKWKTGCYSCPQHRNYPSSFFDNSKVMWKLKKKWFTSVEDMTLVTPSQWLADLVKQSYLNKYPVKVINNGINLSVFKPTPSDFRKNNGIADDQYLILGVSFGWNDRKGLDVIIKLAEELPKDQCRIVLVGTDEKTDKILPPEVISIHRTQNQQELAEIYSASDLFVNPTREEVFGLVNAEALACGTPVLTFKTGGSPEIIDDTCGCIVEKDDIEGLKNEVIRIQTETPYKSDNCVRRANLFGKNEKYKTYISIYGEMKNDRTTTN